MSFWRSLSMKFNRQSRFSLFVLANDKSSEFWISDIFRPPGFKSFDYFRVRLKCIDIVPFYFRKCTDLRSFNWPLSEQKSFSFKLSYNLCLQRLKKLKLLQLWSFKKKSLLKPLDQGQSLFSWKSLNSEIRLELARIEL